ncbi:MAG: hypothetical protein AAF740_07070 [Bacteroidota bacterium]
MKTAVIIINIIFLLLFLPSLGLLMPTVMMFDAPGSTESPYTIFTAISFVLIPVGILVAQGVSWYFFAQKSYATAFWFSLVPLIPVLCAVLGFVLIEVFQGGRFSAS